MAAQANGRLSAEEQIDVSPHVLRQTFLRKLAETTGVHYAREVIMSKGSEAFNTAYLVDALAQGRYLSLRRPYSTG